MITLAMDTSSDRLSVAVGAPERPAVGRQLDGARRHAAALLPVIADLLQEVGSTLEEVDTLALADGPGSFTGLRVGAAVMKALHRARSGRLAVRTASTLLVRAVGAHPPRGARVLVATEALRGELYAALYRLELPDRVEVLWAPRVATPESLRQAAPDLIIGAAPDRLLDRLADRLAAPLVRGVAALPDAVALLELCGIHEGTSAIERPSEWQPEYGRPAEAEARWEEAHGRPLSDSTGRSR